MRSIASPTSEIDTGLARHSCHLSDGLWRVERGDCAGSGRVAQFNQLLFQMMYYRVTKIAELHVDLAQDRSITVRPGGFRFLTNRV